jgi:protein-arginine kinase activator protein McsA
MRQLHYELEKAVEEERYEDAATIKREIDKLMQLYDSFFND